MVRSTASGYNYHLDGMLDFKLRQSSITKGSGPSYLFMEFLHQLRQKPMFQVMEGQQLRCPDLSESGTAEDSASVKATSTVASAAVGSVNTGSVSTVGTHSVVYNDFPLAYGSINLYDRVQDYCAVLATGEDSKPHSVGVVVYSLSV